MIFKNIDLTFKGGPTNVGTQPDTMHCLTENTRIQAMPGEADNKKGMPANLYYRHVNKLNLTNVKVEVQPRDNHSLRIEEDASNVAVKN